MHKILVILRHKVHVTLCYIVNLEWNCDGGDGQWERWARKW